MKQLRIENLEFVQCMAKQQQQGFHGKRFLKR